MTQPTHDAWLHAWTDRMNAAHNDAAERPMVAVIINPDDEGDDVHALAPGVTPADAEEAALAILGNLLDHYASTPADQLCDGCNDRIARVQAAVAALTDGEAAPVIEAMPGARLQ